VPGLIEMCGGEKAFRKRLDKFFDGEYYDVSNQPSFIIPCLYHWIGRPDLSGERIYEIMEKHFNDGPEGLPGNDDSGSMSCWMNFHLIGLYPFAGQDLYLIHAPLIPSVVFHLDKADFTIKTENLSDKNRYIQKAYLNGVEYPYSAIRHRDIAAGGELLLEMGPKPKDWGKELLPTE
jgi:putative alpha-1,2-mannosidase